MFHSGVAILLAILTQPAASFPIQTLQRINLAALQSTKEKGQYTTDAPYREAAYNPGAASDFYKNRRVQSIGRLTQIASKSGKFVVDTVLDSKLKREEKMVDRRSVELLELVSDLGPTFIKVGLRHF